jgi:hypothetical protein
MATIVAPLKCEALPTVHDVAADRGGTLGAGGVCPASRRLSLRVIRPSEEARAEVDVELLTVTQAGNPVGRCCACCDGTLRPPGLTAG